MANDRPMRGLHRGGRGYQMMVTAEVGAQLIDHVAQQPDDETDYWDRYTLEDDRRDWELAGLAANQGYKMRGRSAASA